MKYIASADWHIHSWHQHSTVDEKGVPSRLMDFIALSNDIVEIGRRNGVEGFIFAGDWLQYHGPKPMVLNVAAECLKILSDGFKYVYFMDGNHDVDQKTGQYDQFHSGLRAIISNAPNIRYVATPTLLTLPSGRTAYFRPWNHEHDKYEEFERADIFVGHGLVNSATDPHGHEFSNGYNVGRLGDMYSMSIIGDIHSGQVLGTDPAKGRVLIPGQPIQINHTSDENCGVWILDDHDYSLGFCSISNDQNVTENQYHRFFKREEAAIPKDRPPYVHYSVARVKAPKAADVGVAAPMTITDIPQLVRDEVGALKVKDRTLADSIVTAAFDTYRAVPTVFGIAPSRLLSTDISNFGAIDALYIDFANWDGEVLVTGRNGSGKSTFLEAIYWSITGELTKDTPVGRITRKGSPRPAEVTTRFEIRNQECVIVRSRDESRLLDFTVGGTSLKKASAADTQREIYQVLGIAGPKDVLALCYFSVKKSVNFSDMTASNQYDTLSRLVDLAQFEHFRASITTQLEVTTKEYESATNRLSFLTDELEVKASSLARMKGQSAENPYLAPLVTKYALAVTTIYEANVALTAKVDAIHKRVDSTAEANLARALERGRELQRAFQDQTSRSVTLTSAINGNRDKHAALVSLTCSECGQKVPDDPVKRQALLDQMRAAAIELHSNKTAIAQTRADQDANQATVAALQRAVEANQQLNAEARFIQLEISDLTSHASSASQEVVNHLTDEIRDYDARIETAQKDLDLLAPRYETLKLIKDKLLAKNSPINLKIYLSVFEQMIVRINQLVDPGLVRVQSDSKKSLSMSIKFGAASDYIESDDISTGERRLLDVLTLVALNSMIYERYGVKDGFLSFAAYDEVMTYLDPQFMEAAQSAISALDCRTKIIVTHEEGLMSYYRKGVRVVKKGKVAEYQLVNFNV